MQTISWNNVHISWLWVAATHKYGPALRVIGRGEALHRTLGGRENTARPVKLLQKCLLVGVLDEASF